MFALLLALAAPAHAASLDLVEVAGPWGTPATTNPSAAWWNPAGLAVGRGTQFLVEGAPVIAQIVFDRDQPDYGIIDRDNDGIADETYDYSGTDTINYFGVAPFIGVSSDFGVKGLGVGGALVVPYARGGTEATNPGVGRYTLRDGGIQTIYGTLAAAYDIANKVAIGASGSYVDSTWSAQVDTEAVTTLYDQLNSLGLATTYYSDADTENPAYGSVLDFRKLHDNTFTFGAGVHVHPKDSWALAVSYNHSVKLAHEGELGLQFACPPDEDTIGNLGAGLFGLCDTTTGEGTSMTGSSTVAYTLPWRINAGLTLHPSDDLRLEVMGAYVAWNVFKEYNIDVVVPPDAVPLDTEEGRQQTADLITQNRDWARDNHATFWAGVDSKYTISEHFGAGGRVLFDHSAIPNSALSTNNFDTDSLNVTALGWYEPVDKLQIGLSVGQQILFSRTVTDSAFRTSINPVERNEDRYFYPEMNGHYSGRITRLGLSVKGRFGGDKN